MKQSLLRIAIIVLAVVLFFILMVGPGFLAAPITLFIGWWASLVRFSKAWHFNSNAVWLFLFAMVALVAGTHVFLRWLYASLRNKQENALPSRWPLKWTICGCTMLFCALLAVCSVVLTTHQIYWISKSSDALFADPFRERINILYEAKTLQKDAEELNWDSAKTRASFWQRGSSSIGRPALETIQPVWIEKDGHTLRAIILIPRRPMFHATTRLAIIQSGSDLAMRNLNELPQVLSSFGIGNITEGSNRPTVLLP
jgi:hypothetical protein